MSDALETALSGTDRPRALDPSFRERLLRSMVGEAGSDAPAPVSDQWRIDGPRPLPATFRARLERRMVRRPRSEFVRAWLAAAIAASLVASIVVVNDRTARPPSHQGTLALPTTAPTARPTRQPTRRPPGSLQTFSSAGAFLRYVRTQALKSVNAQDVGYQYGGYGGPVQGPIPVDGPAYGGPWYGGSWSGGAGIPVTAPPMPDAPVAGGYSSTNIQEEGVDEPDIVKTDGRRLFVLSAEGLRIIDVRGSQPRLRSTFAAPNARDMFLAGDRAVLFTPLYGAPAAAGKITHVKYRAWTKVTVVDVADTASPKLVASFEIEGWDAGARLASGVVRLIVQSGSLGPPAAAVTKPTKAAVFTATALTRLRIRHSVVGDWVPHYVVERPGRPAVAGHVHGWAQVSRPPDQSGLGMITILTIDPRDPRPNNAESIVGSGQIVYADPEHLFVTSNRFDDLRSRIGSSASNAITRIHEFDISDPQVSRYLGSGEVPGYLLNQYSLSERDGYLRVASTLEPPWVPESGHVASRNLVTVLKMRAGRLVPVGSVGNLGRGERIYSVRFVGSIGYVVTFRQIDPLFVIDLRRPNKPRVVGSLRMSGYSGYLHPISDTLLLGIGQAVDAHAVPLGLQISLFDVSDPARPRRISVRTFQGHGSAAVQNDPHAFLYWAPLHLTVVPAAIFPGDTDNHAFLGALAFTADAEGLGRAIRLTHAGRPHLGDNPYDIQRALVIDDRLYTVSFAGVLVSDLRTFADRVWLPFAR